MLPRRMPGCVRDFLMHGMPRVEKNHAIACRVVRRLLMGSRFEQRSDRSVCFRHRRVASSLTPDALDSVNVRQFGQRKRFRIESIQAMRRKRFGKFIDHCRIFGQAADDDVARQVGRVDDIAELRV